MLNTNLCLSFILIAWDCGMEENFKVGEVMEMFSLLNKHDNREIQAERPVFFLDLNIDQIIDKISGDWVEDIRELYYVLPEDQETEDYRRAVFTEIKREGVLPVFLEFLELMRQRMFCAERKEKVEDAVQKHVWHIQEAGCYVGALELLKENLGEFSLQSEGMGRLMEFLAQCVSDAEYRTFKEEVFKLRDELKGFRMLLTYEKDRFTVSEGTGTGTYSDFLSECFPENNKTFKSPFLSFPDISDLEREAIRVFKKSHKDFFDKAERFYKKHDQYAKEEMLLLQKETAYYVAYLQFMQKMQEQGFEFCTPSVSGDRLSATGLYDLALALASLENGRKIVSNDVDLWPEESFFILTGPNQGGKTTFARSLGQMVYFTKMGLDIPARAALVPYYKKILTHFSVEESAESGRGKLMDELLRLKPMMGEEQTGAFVVINELFTTAANYDACIMGKKVLEYFIEQNCKGIYVTHLNELSRACPSVVSQRAAVDENLVPTYIIQRNEAEEITGASRQVERYGLTYRQIKERFS